MNNPVKCGFPRSRPTGLTLIELLASLVLMAVLLAAIFGLLPKFAGLAVEEESVSDSTGTRWHRRAMHRIADDLSNTESITLGRSFLRLHGRLGRNQESGRMNDTDDVCEYRLSPIGEDSFLLQRRQGGQGKLLGFGSVEIQLESEQGRDTVPFSVRLPNENADATIEYELPHELRLTLKSNGAVLASTSIIRRFRVAPNVVHKIEVTETVNESP